MFKVKILFLVFLFILKNSIVKANEISNEEMAACTDALVKIGHSELHISKEEHYSYHNNSGERSFRYFWQKNSVNRAILKDFANKIYNVKNEEDFHIYEHRLINAIFSFMSKMRYLIKSGYIKIDVIPDYIQNIINIFDNLSPTEMFIHTLIIEAATQQLENHYRINFEYHGDEFKEMLNDLPNVLQSKEQKRYSILQKETNQAIAELSPDNYLRENEYQMNSRGYIKTYVAGFDHANAQLKLAQSLRKRHADPYVTHIPEFANLIDSYIGYIKISVASQKSPDKEVRLKKIDILEKEAQSRRSSETVTYQWWFDFNLRLAILVTPKKYRNANSLLKFADVGELIEQNKLETFHLEFVYNTGRLSIEEVIEDNGLSFLLRSIQEFPDRIMIPTTHNLGIISINKLYHSGISLIRLRNRPIDVEGARTYPDNYFIYDINHHISSGRVDDRSQYFNFYFQRKLGELAKLEREMVEHIYFKLTYEDFSFLEFMEYKNSLKEHKTQQYKNNSYIPLLRFIPDDLSQDYDGVKEFLNTGEEIIIRLVSEMSEELCVLRRSSLINLSEQQIISLYYLMVDHFLQ